MADEEIGLKAVMDVKDFDKGVKAYIKGLDDAEDETKTSGKKIQSSLKKLTSQLDKTSKGFTRALGKGALGAARVGLKGLAMGAAGAAAAVVGLAVGAGKLASDAAGIPQVADAFEKLGGNLGEMRAGSLGMVTDIDLMTQFNKATSLVSESFAKDLPNSMDIVNKAAAATGQDVGFLMDSLVTGVGRVSPMILDNLGVQVSLTEASEAYAKANGLVASEMTKNEQQMAVYEMTMAKLEETYGELPDVMGTAAQAQAAFGATMQNLKDTVGVALLPVWNTLMSKFGELATTYGPQVAEIAGKIAAWLGEKLPVAIQAVVEWVKDRLVPAFETFTAWVTDTAVPAFKKIVDWLKVRIPEAIQAGRDAWKEFEPKLKEVVDFIKANAEPILAGLAAVLVVLVVPAIYSMVAAGVAFMVAWAPIILLVAAIGVAVALLVKAWQSDFGGIRTFMTDLWENTLKPAFEDIKEWLAVAIPAAIKTLTDFWNNKLVPAFQAVSDFVTGTLVPAFMAVVDWLKVKVPEAIEAVTGFWKDTLMPAFKAVSDFVTKTLIPAFVDIWEYLSNTFGPVIEEIGGLIGDVLGFAFEALVAIIENVLVPAIEDIWKWLGDKLGPVVTEVAGFFSDVFTEALETVSSFLTETLVPAIKAAVEWIGEKLEGAGKTAEKAIGPLKAIFQGVADTALKITDGIAKLREKLSGFKLPAWLQRHSPAPIEQTFSGLQEVINLAAGAFSNFANSISSGDAERIEKGADAVEEMAEAFRSLLSLRAVASAQESGGGLIAMDDFLSQLDEMFTKIIDLTQAIQNKFSYKQIKELDKTATRIRRMFDAMTLEMDKIALADLPNLDAWAQQILDVVVTISNALIEIDRIQGNNSLIHAGKVADIAGKIFSFVRDAVDTLAKMAEYKPLDSLTASMTNMTDRLIEVVPLMLELAKKFDLVAVQAASDFFTAAQSVLGFIKPAIDALVAIAEYEPVQVVLAAVQNLRDQVLAIVAELIVLDHSMDLEAVQAAGSFYSASQTVLGFISNGITALASMAEYAGVTIAEGVVAGFRDAVVGLVLALSAGSSELDTEGVQAAGAFYTAAGAVVGFITAGLEALDAFSEFRLFSYNWWTVASFRHAIAALVTNLSLIRLQVDQEATDAAAAIAGGLTTLVGIVVPGLEALKVLGGEVVFGDVTANAEQFRLAFEALVTKLQEAALNLDSDGLTAAAAVSQSIIDIVGIVSPVIEALKSFLDYPEELDLDAYTLSFKEDLKKVVDMVQELATDYETLGTDFGPAATFSKAITDAIGFISPAIAALQELFEMRNFALGTALGNFDTQLRALFTVIQNIVRDWGDTTVQNAAVLVRAIDAAAEAVEHAAATLAYLVSLASGQTADLSFGNILADVNLMDNAMARFADNGLRRVEQAMSRVSQSIDQAAASIARMNNQLGSFTVPASLIGHSPPPLANWLNEVAVGAANAALGFGGMRRGLSQQQPLYQAPSTTVNRTNSVSLSVSVGQMGGNMTPERLGAFLNDYLVRALS